MTNQQASPVLVKTVHRHSLGGFAVYTRTEKPGLPETVKLATVLKDHLGSTDVILTGKWNGSAFTDVQTERQSFDPWGERRDPGSFVTYRQTDTDAYRTSANDYDRGYTGHEQLDDSGLIHMNGRIYDPELGRMLSPDPYVQVPEYSQNFNRYSYVLNNPLNATDPTGYSWISNAFSSVGSWFKENWRQVVVIVVVAIVTWGVGAAFVAAGNAALAASGGVYSMSVAITSFTVMGTGGTAVLSTAGMAATGAIAGAVGGGLGAALNGGDLNDVLRGAAVGGIQGAIAGGVLHGMEPGSTSFSPEMAAHVAGHGVLGGASNAAMGGKFQDGFLSAAASAGASDLGVIGGSTVAERTIKAGVIGGTASALGGGKFMNGACTSAFQYLTNESIAELQKYKEMKGNEWSSEYRNEIIKHYSSMKLDQLESEISNLKKTMFVFLGSSAGDSVYRAAASGAYSWEGYYKYASNIFQSYEAAILAKVRMYPDSFAADYHVSGSLGFALGAAGQVGVTVDSWGVRWNGAWGVGWKGPIVSLGFGKGGTSASGSSVHAISAGAGLGATIDDAGGFEYGVTTPGWSFMKVKYK